MIIPQFHPVPGFQLDHPSAAAWIEGQHDLQIPASHRGIRIIRRVADGRRPNLGDPWRARFKIREAGNDGNMARMANLGCEWMPCFSFPRCAMRKFLIHDVKGVAFIMVGYGPTIDSIMINSGS